MRIKYLWVSAAAILVMLIASSSLYAQGPPIATIGGCIYTGGASVTYTQNALGEPVVNWNTVYHDPNATYNPGDPGAPIDNAQVMVQNQHSGGAFITYGTVGAQLPDGTIDPNQPGNCWMAEVPAPGDYVVMFSAPGHDATSREFTVDELGNVTNPTGSGATQDAYLPPLFDLDGEGVANDLPRANLLHYVFYDKKVNGNDDGTLIEPGLNGVTVNVYDEEGNLLASKVTGAEPFVTADGVDFTAPGSYYGYVYFTDLPAGELIVESDPSTVTQADNPHFTLYNPDDLSREWYLTYTEEGGPTWEVNLYPGDPGTEAGLYLTWHGFIEKLGNDAGGNPALSGSISGVVMDADGNDPEEPFPITLGGRVAPTNSGYATGLDVEPNSRIPYGAVALYTVGDFPELVATTEATQPTGQNDPNGGEFTFVNVPPGQYELFAWDIPLNNVPMMGIGVTVNPGVNSSVAILMPRFGARVQGYVMKNGTPVAGATVKVHYKSGITKQETTTDANGWFNFEFLPEIEVMGHVVLDLPDGSTIRGKIITEQFDEDGAGPAAPITVTHNAMNRYVQWMTYNYFADIQVEDIPADKGDINGVVFYDHFARGTWVGDGVWDDHEERTLQGVTVELWNADGTVKLGETTTGKFDKAATIAQGWDEPYTWPPNEIGGVFAGPALGFYEFRDLAPGDYMVKVIPPTGYQRSPELPIMNPVTVIAGHSRRVDLGLNTRPSAADPVGVPLAGEIEGGVFDDINLDMNPLSLLFQEKAGIVGAPVGVYDHYNYPLGVMYMGNPLCYAGSTVCPPGEDPVQKPEAERRFAPGVHRYLGNDPAFPGFNPDFSPFELSYIFPQGGYKFEADWSLLPAALTAGGPTADMCVVDLVGVDIPAETWGAQVTATVADGWSPIAGAEVVGTWSTKETMKCITDGAGQCTITLEKVEPGDIASVTFDVTNVRPPEGQNWYVYNPAANPNGFTCDTTITINNPTPPPPPPPPPALQAVITGPTQAQVGEVVTFDGSQSTGQIGNYAWDFGDGNTGQGVTVNHSYSAAGTYTVTLTVADQNDPNITNSATAQIQIDNAPPPPPPAGAVVVADLQGQGTIKEGIKWYATVTLTVEDGGTPVAGVKVFYTWTPGESKECKTKGNGQCTIKSQTIENPNVTSITFTVDNVNDPNYDPGGSVTSITINRP